jgi:hypothetical protein
MLHLLNQQLGRILLVLALGLAGAAIYFNPPQKLEEVSQSDASRPVRVTLDQGALKALGDEVFFTQDDDTHFMGVTRAVWVKEKTILVFQPVDLEIPPASVMRPPQLLPEPGPSLEGASKLPRFGDEFAPIVVIDNKPGSRPAQPNTPNTQAPSTTPKTPVKPGEKTP